MLAVMRTAAANIFIPLTLGSGIHNTTINPDGMPHPTLKVEGMYFHAISDVSSTSHENYQNNPVQKMESLI
jgi:glutamine amidotransferase/cyclase